MSRRTVPTRDVLGAGKLDDFRRIETPHGPDGLGATREARCRKAHGSRQMEEREGGENRAGWILALGFGQASDCADEKTRHHEADQGSMTHEAALGSSGRARGEEEEGGIVLIDRIRGKQGRLVMHS